MSHAQRNKDSSYLLCTHGIMILACVRQNWPACMGRCVCVHVRVCVWGGICLRLCQLKDVSLWGCGFMRTQPPLHLTVCYSSWARCLLIVINVTITFHIHITHTRLPTLQLDLYTCTYILWSHLASVCNLFRSELVSDRSDYLVLKREVFVSKCWFLHIKGFLLSTVNLKLHLILSTLSQYCWVHVDLVYVW